MHVENVLILLFIASGAMMRILVLTVRLDFTKTHLQKSAYNALVTVWPVNPAPIALNARLDTGRHQGHVSDALLLVVSHAIRLEFAMTANRVCS